MQLHYNQINKGEERRERGKKKNFTSICPTKEIKVSSTKPIGHHRRP